MGNIIGLKSRDELSKKLQTLYINNCAEKLIFLKGPSGSGKSYIINQVINRIEDIVNNISFYTHHGDDIVLYDDKKLSNFKINDVSLSIGTPVVSIGGGIGFENNRNQYQILRKILKKDHSNSIVFFIDGLSKTENSVKLFAKYIIENVFDLEQEFSKHIFLLVTDTNNDSFNNYFNASKTPPKIYDLSPYSSDDILDYLKLQHSSINIDNELKNKINQIQKITNGNLSLVDFLFVDMQFQNEDYFEALERIVSQKLSQLKISGIKKNINESDMEDIILSSSLSLQKFTSVSISKVTERETNIVTTSLNIAKNDAFLDKDTDCFFSFHCDEIHNILRNKSLEKQKERLLYYYQYYTETEQDEYYLRSYYLTNYYGYFSSQSFSLIVLAYISSNQLQDFDRIGRIKKTVSQYANNKQIEEFLLVKEFIELVRSNNSDNDVVYKQYKLLKRRNFELPLKGALARLCFHFFYSYSSPENKYLKILADECIQYAQNELVLSYFQNPIELQQYDETIIRLMLIYEVTPYILDVLNDYERFNELYNLSKQFTLNANTKGAMGLAQYIQNIFNRKAFLFVNQTQCEIYYEKAKKYFFDNGFWEEYCITLICQAGTDIVIQKYDEAQENCILAQEVAKDEEIVIPQLPKLHNNYLIASFLEYEQNESDINKCMIKANNIAELLEKQLTGKPSATEFVIITNICSLYLYCNNENEYNKYKKQLEHLLACNDVSDINDENIGDFYRYYFSWFELYKTIMNENWESASLLLNKIDGFVPTLFKKQEIFWTKKVEAVKIIIELKKHINSYDFCNELVKTERRETLLSKFFYRGLMLSDIQYTSYY